MKKQIEELLQKILTLFDGTPGKQKPKKTGGTATEQKSRLSRQELLEVLVNQSKHIDELEAQLREANEKLAQREIDVANAGTLAEAALKLNHIFEDADAACQQYRESLKAMAERAAREEERQ
jgi:hypothetical protein